MKKIIFTLIIVLFSTESFSKNYLFNKCYGNNVKHFSEMNMRQNSYNINTETKTVINHQYRNETNQSIINKYNIEKIDKDIIRATNVEKETFLVNLKIFLNEKKVEVEMFLYDTKTLKKTNVKQIYICE
jgi:hypothetical protein